MRTSGRVSLTGRPSAASLQSPETLQAHLRRERDALVQVRWCLPVVFGGDSWGLVDGNAAMTMV